ncbi:MAG: arsenate reductase (glutaredoxin) [Bacteroidales bacterium]|nr:arsenate reductase (glutaredoxin) [Bacteroidales bacterium]
MIRIYHNPKCRKSRAGLQYLQEKGIGFTVVEYLKNQFTEKQLENLLVKLNLKPEEIVRKQEEYYRKNLKGKEFNDHEWIRILVENPKLIMRPIVERKYKAVIGDPVDNIEEFMRNQ